jgi:hypothetical protein
LAASSLDNYSLGSCQDVQVAVSIGVLIARFYGELWNRWDDSAVEETLSPGFAFRGSLGRETSERQGWRRYRDLVHAGSADFTTRSRSWCVTVGGRRHGFASPVRIPGRCWGCLQRSGGSSTRGQPFTADERWLTGAWVLGDLDALRRQLS